MASAAVSAAKGRRAARASRTSAEIQWFIDGLKTRVDLSLKQRVHIATVFLHNRIVENISKPVGKAVIGGRTVVTARSKSGEFPRADTTQLMKTLFWDVTTEDGNPIGHVGTPLDYGVDLELRRHRRYLVRTLEEEYERLVSILTGPVT